MGSVTRDEQENEPDPGRPGIDADNVGRGQFIAHQALAMMATRTRGRRSSCTTKALCASLMPIVAQNTSRGGMGTAPSVMAQMPVRKVVPNPTSASKRTRQLKRRSKNGPRQTTWPGRLSSIASGVIVVMRPGSGDGRDR